MTASEVQRDMALIDASKKIAAIYLHYGQVQEAQAEIAWLGKALAAASPKQIKGGQI